MTPVLVVEVMLLHTYVFWILVYIVELYPTKLNPFLNLVSCRLLWRDQSVAMRPFRTA
jgi:hypothetical protein